MGQCYNRGINMQLAQIYKQINAPVGPLALASLARSTQALNSGSAADDSAYANFENQYMGITSQRDALASQMIALLEGAAFNGQTIPQDPAKQLIAQGNALLVQVTGN